MILTVQFRRRIKRIWKEWLLVPVIIGASISVLVFLVLTIISTAKKYERTWTLPQWPPSMSVWSKDYLDFSKQKILLQPDLNVNSPYCEETDKILIMVASSPSNLMARREIRKTWGERGSLREKGIKIAFVMGRPDNFRMQHLLTDEAREFNDIIQDDFVDSFHNQTLKSLAMLKWVRHGCSRILTTQEKDSLKPHWILKVKDDTFININRLLKVAKDMPYSALVGNRICNERPQKDTHSPFYMPKYLYRWSVYPAFLSGNAYMLRTDIVPDLLENMDATPLIPIEDIYVTGILARRSYYFPDHSPYFSSKYNETQYDICKVKNMVAFYNVTVEKMKQMSEKVTKSLNVTCPKEPKVIRGIGGGRYLRMTEKERKICLIPSAREKYFIDEQNPDVYDGFGYFSDF